MSCRRRIFAAFLASFFCGALLFAGAHQSTVAHGHDHHSGHTIDLLPDEMRVEAPTREATVAPDDMDISGVECTVAAFLEALQFSFLSPGAAPKFHHLHSPALTETRQPSSSIAILSRAPKQSPPAIA